MPSSTSLSGLMKWLRHDPWRDAFSDALECHLNRACSKAGIEIGELAGIIGNDWAATLWGCAFEDFLTRDLDEGGNIVEDYLKHRGWKETAHNKAYMTALKSSVMSLYEVCDVKYGESFLARDLFRGGEPVRISERTATRTLKQWDWIAARVVEVQGKTIIGGGLLPFDYELGETLLTSLCRTQKGAAKGGAEVMRGLNPGIGPAELDKAFGSRGMLRLAAPLISTIWLNDVLEKALNPQLPEVRNSDGEELVFLSVQYRLLPGVTVKRVREVLDRLPDLRPVSATFWNWLASSGSPSGRSQSKSQRGLRFMSTMGDGSVVLGSLELKGKMLLLSVNSESRAERGRAMLAPVIEGLVGEPLIERRALARVMAERPADRTDAAFSDISPEEERRIVHETLDGCYRKQLDEPIPMLGNVTPRKAAETAEGREKLVTWLKRLENHMAKREPSGPMAGYDVAWLWKELGVADRRK